jgi:hypothetical protein
LVLRVRALHAGHHALGTKHRAHRFTWRRDQITWESHDANGSLIDSYAYTGADVPRSGDERVHLNLWLFNGSAPTNGSAAEVVLSSFVFAR